MFKVLRFSVLIFLMSLSHVVNAAGGGIVTDFTIELNAYPVVGALIGNYRISSTRVVYYMVRQGKPIVSGSTDPNASECHPREVYGGTSLNRFISFQFTLTNSSTGVTIPMNNSFGSLVCQENPNAEVMDNNTIGSIAANSIWGGVNVWKALPSDFGFQLGDSFKICFGIGGSETGCTDGEYPSKPVTPGEGTVSCTLPSSVTLDHGTVNAESLQGNTVSKSVIITCTGTATADVSVGAATGDKDGQISLGSGIDSAVSINNSVGHADINLNQGSNSVNLSSRLSRTGSVKSGDYKGAGVLVMEVQ